MKQEARRLDSQIHYCMSQLTRQVKRRDRLRHRRERQYNLVTAILQASSPKRSKEYFVFVPIKAASFLKVTFGAVFNRMRLVCIEALHRLLLGWIR